MPNDIQVTCPKCGANIPLTEAVSHQLRAALATDFEKQRKQLLADITAREDKLKQGQQSLQSEVAGRVEEERKKLATEAARQAEEKLGLQLKDLQAQLAENQSRLRATQETELALRKKQREVEDAKANLELEVARKLDAERQKIADLARQQGAEAERLRLTEKEKVIADLQREIENLRQKAEQGSMQLQGEALELDLEAQLRAAFRYDAIAEVKKGERGADTIQRVRTNSGLECGTILWEAKRAKNWSAQWVEKLKEDQRQAKAELAVLVTTCPPEGLRGIGQIETVWVCEAAYAVALATALRQGLVATATQRLQHTGRTDKMSLLYDYLCGLEFRQHIQAVVEAFCGLQEQLAAEQRAFARQWKEREQQIQRAIQHTAMLYGSVQGIAGREALPEITPLQLPTSDADA